MGRSCTPIPSTIIRENPRRLLECWCEVVGPKGRDQPPWILQKFPNSYGNEEILKSVPQFAFPSSFDSTNVQHFSFVLTSLDSKWTYGFCRHAPGSETALVIISHLPWHETFYKLLNQLSEMISSGRESDMKSCLQNIYKSSVPHPGSEITIPYGENKFFVAQCTNHLKLPTIPENRNLSEYYNAIDANNMVIIFASMLYERRIIIVSKKLSRLSACVQAANSIIYPMQWQHIFIPVLPQHLIEYLLAPMPFLIGVNTSLLSRVQMDDIGEAVILDADNNSVKTPFNDLETLPDEVIINLKRSLKSPNNMLGDSVARAFLRALVQLIGNYKEALQFREEDSKITFNHEKFVNIRPVTFQPFVEKMLELQIFQQFIEERLERLNSGKQTSDEFELEVSVYCEKSSSKMKQQYKQFVTNVRKESGAIMKTVKSKTNPAVKSAVKTVTKSGKQVREKSRQTYKDLRGKIKEIQHPRPGEEEGTPPWMNDCILAIRRFSSRRGLPSVFYSDNAKTFLSASQKLQHYVGPQTPQWKFIAPYSPWWERLIRSVKSALRKTLGVRSLSRCELETTLHEVEACVNSRPLTFVGDEPNIDAPLTPSHFLIGRVAGYHPEIANENPLYISKRDLTEREVFRQQKLDVFWRIWSDDYLRNLPPVVKGFVSRCNLRKGSIVLVRNESMSRLYWPLGVVLEVYPGRDGIVRSASVKTSKGVICRSVQRLHDLEISHSLPDPSAKNASSLNTDSSSNVQERATDVPEPDKHSVAYSLLLNLTFNFVFIIFNYLK